MVLLSMIVHIIYVYLLFHLHAGEAHSLKVEKILFQGKSDYQDVMVFQVLGCLTPIDLLSLIPSFHYIEHK